MAGGDGVCLFLWVLAVGAISMYSRRGPFSLLDEHINTELFMLLHWICVLKKHVCMDGYIDEAMPTCVATVCVTGKTNHDDKV